MEKEGLQRALDFICRESGLTVREIVTDRHPMIIKFLREEMKGTKHSIDVWHVGKGMKKRMIKLAKEKDCEELLPWIKSIINHLYWVAASTPDANRQLMCYKWQSLSNHLHNVHDHITPGFPACLHGKLTGRDRKKKWLTEGSKLSVKLLGVLDSAQMRKDIPMLSTGSQTSAIEGFHSVLNHFAPKMIGFSYHGIHHRTCLAALHFNENVNRKQATDHTVTGRYKQAFKKSKKDFTIQEVKVDITFDYVDRLMAQVWNLASTKSRQDIVSRIKAQRETQRLPRPLCAAYAKPDKDQAVRSLKSRFKTC